MKIKSIQIINPDTKEPVSVQEWAKQQDPTRAEWILIETDELKPFCVNKKLAGDGKDYTFAEALDAGNRLTRAQALAIYDARYNGLVEAMELIGGDDPCEWVWTCEADADAHYNASDAWFMRLSYGNVHNDDKSDRRQVRLISAFPLT